MCLNILTNNHSAARLFVPSIVHSLQYSGAYESSQCDRFHHRLCTVAPFISHLPAIVHFWLGSKTDGYDDEYINIITIETKILFTFSDYLNEETLVMFSCWLVCTKKELC